MKDFETSPELAETCLRDLYLNPRRSLEKWSKITEQTMQVRLAYPGQHLASVITGVKGAGTAARGDDLSDGTEVKSCSRADQLSECNNCGAKVLAWQEECPDCKSTDINIKTDSHWIINIPSEKELDIYLNHIPRLILILFDRPEQATNIIRVRAWTVNPKHPYYRAFLEDYYHNNYLKKVQQGRNPAPCNLHPLQYDFHMMEPSLIFEAQVDIDNGEVAITHWDLDNPQKEPIPSNLLTMEQLDELFSEREILEAVQAHPNMMEGDYVYARDPSTLKKLQKKDYVRLFPQVPEEKRAQLGMRKKITKSYKEEYRR